MSRYVFKMPDLGEGAVAAEVVACHIRVGDTVAEEQVILEVMTEKATVEISSPVGGRVLSISGEVGQSIAVGAEVVAFEVDAPQRTDEATLPRAPVAPREENARIEDESSIPSAAATRIMASPATRHRAKEAGVDLAHIPGSGPAGRITPADLNRHLNQDLGPSTSKAPTRAESTAILRSRVDSSEAEEIAVIGVRRIIAQRMSEAKRTIPHFSYVEEVDITELDALRLQLNAKMTAEMPGLSYLPFIAAALVNVLTEFPQCNAHYDSARNLIVRHRALHLGIATQTPDGLKVPVVRHVERRSLDDIAAEIRRVSAAARSGESRREDLSGSTLTLTSLGRLGGIVSTPIINAPELTIIGINKAEERVVARQGVAVVRRMMNLSSSFDHRFIDGHDAAKMIQALKAQLEHPALIFFDVSSVPAKTAGRTNN